MSLEADENFISYCEIHSRTERALFSGADVRRLADLAGHTLPAVDPKGWYTLRTHACSPLVDAARDRLRSARMQERDTILAAGFVEGAHET